jgi:hypothetical protein
LTWLAADFEQIDSLRLFRISRSGRRSRIVLQCGRQRCVRAYSVHDELVARPARTEERDHPVDFRRLGTADSPRIPIQCVRNNPEGRIVTSAIPRQRGTGTPEDEFANLGLGSSLALGGLLAVVKIAETATGVVLTATGVLPGANPPKERPGAWPGGE